MSSSKDFQDSLKGLKLSSPTLEDIRDAAKNIVSKAVRTPLVRLNPHAKYKNQTVREVGCLYGGNISKLRSHIL